MPHLSTPFLCPLTRRHATSHASVNWRYMISRSSSSSPAKVETFSFSPERTANTQYSSTTTQGNSAGDRGSLPVETLDFPQVIPEILPGRRRTLVLCFDGTNEKFDKDLSNIVRFFRLLKKDDPSKQMVYYQPGIGTGVGPGGGTSILTGFYNSFDAAFAFGLEHHVRGGYEFLMQNYTKGDRIALFGFSRGAYTARALAGMLQKVGLLAAYNHVQVPHAYGAFRDHDDWNNSNEFKRAFSVDVEIDFMGAFDTVSRVGINTRKLPFSKSNSLIRVYRHALALDERRSVFGVSLWNKATKQEEKLGESGKHGTYHSERSADGKTHGFVTKEEPTDNSDNAGKNFEQKPDTSKSLDSNDNSGRKRETDVKEVWFVGAHSDVGGGSVQNKTPRHLARIPLRWMVRECFTKKTGILFHSAELEKLGLSPDTLWPEVKTPILPTEGIGGSNGKVVSEKTAAETLPNNLAESTQNPFLVPSQGQEAEDAVSDIHDKDSIWWRILELLPPNKRHHLKSKSWWTWLTTPLSPSTSRVIHEQTPYVHRSVLYRSQKLGYTPYVKLPANSQPEWVE